MMEMCFPDFRRKETCYIKKNKNRKEKFNKLDHINILENVFSRKDSIGKTISKLQTERNICGQ